MPISYKNKIYTTLGTPTVMPGNSAFITNGTGVPAKDYTVKGKTIVWNQMLDKSKYLATITIGGVTFTNNGDGSITVSGTSTASDYSQYALFGNVYVHLTVIANHKYFFSLHNYSTEPGFIWVIGGTSDPVFNYFEASKKGFITTSLGSKTGTCYMILRVNKGISVDNKITRPQLFDLTEIFGAGNEPSTPEEFRAMFPDDYYPYNSGELKTIVPMSVEASGVERFQMLDKSKYPATTTINGVTFTNNGDGTIIANGTAGTTVATWYNLKNNIEIPAGHKMLISGGVTGASWSSYLFYDDSDASHSVDIPGGGRIYTTKTSSVKPILFVAKGYTVSNLIFKPQLFDLTQMFGAGNEPATPAEFWQRVPEKLYGYNPSAYKSANIPSSKYFPDGMRSAGSAYDEINFLSQKAIKRIGVVDLGTLNWSYGTSHTAFQTNDLDTEIKIPATSSDAANLICTKYSAESYASGWAGTIDKCCGTTFATGAKWFWIRDTAYTDAAAFKAAMSGVMLYYELATPVETAITPPLQALSTYKGFTSFSAPNSLMQNGPLSVTYYAEGGANPEKGWLTSYKRKLYMGRNIEWNQLLDRSKYRATTTKNGVTFTNNGDGTITANGTATADEWFKITSETSPPLQLGHKMFLIGCPSGGGWSSYLMRLLSSNDDAGNGKIFSANAEEIRLHIFIKSGYTATNLKFKPQLFDLTQMFGAGNEPATPAEFWSYFDHKLYPYNTGETQPLFKISRKSWWSTATNLADPTSPDWKTDYRISSSAIVPQQGKTVSNPITCKIGDVVRVKGVNFVANEDRYQLSGKNASGTEFYQRAYVSSLPDTALDYTFENNIHTFTVKYNILASDGTIRFAFTTPANVNDIIITLNENIPV